MMRRGLLAIPLAIPLIALGAPKSHTQSHTKTHVIVLHGMKFDPGSLQIKAGEKIEWKNDDIVPHTVTDSAGHFDSGAIEAGKSWHLVLKKPGHYTYFCSFHPTMKATLDIQ
jgi:plastocyanin